MHSMCFKEGLTTTKYISQIKGGTVGLGTAGEVITLDETYKNDINHAREMIKKMPLKILVAADSILDTALHRYEFGKKKPDDEYNEDLHCYRTNKDIAAYIYSKMLSVDKDIVEKAIEETAKGYSKGNLVTYEITRNRLLANLESILNQRGML